MWRRALDVLQVGQVAVERVELLVEGAAVDAVVDREPSGVTDAERRGDRVERPGFGCRRVLLDLVVAGDDVEAVLGPAAGQLDVTGFLVERVGSDTKAWSQVWPWALSIVVA